MGDNILITRSLPYTPVDLVLGRADIALGRIVPLLKKGRLQWRLYGSLRSWQNAVRVELCLLINAISKTCEGVASERELLEVLLEDKKGYSEQMSYRYLSNRLAFYKKEWDYLQKATTPLPIYILYPVLHPGKALSPSQELGKKDFLMAVSIWKEVLSVVETEPSKVARRSHLL